MSLTGACPGTVLPQLATGVPSSLFIGIGGILGGMVFATFVDKKVTRGEVSSWEFLGKLRKISDADFR